MSLLFKIDFKEIRQYTCFLLLFFLPINQKVSTLLIVINSVLVLIDYKNISAKKLKNNWPLLVFYLTYIVIGSLIREEFLLKHLEYKLSFLFMPLIFHNYNRYEIKQFIKAFIIGLLSFYLILWFQAFSDSFSEGQFNYKPNENLYGFFENGLKGGNYFLGEYFVRHLQSLYFSLYYAIGILFLNSLKLFKTKIKNIIIAVFVFAIIQSLSKTGVLLLFILIIYLSRNYILKFKWAFVFIIPLFFGLIYIINPRISNYVNDVYEEGLHLDPSSPESIDMRLLTWKASSEIIRKKPIIGYGVLEAQYELNKNYVENQYRFPLRYRLNAHNLYLQILIEGGFLVLSIFLLVKGYLIFRYGVSNLTLGFLLLCSISFMFESYFSRYLGISFFALFYSLILNLYENEKQ